MAQFAVIGLGSFGATVALELANLIMMSLE
jgi:Trk K+ transport system NAD-binding subunit